MHPTPSLSAEERIAYLERELASVTRANVALTQTNTTLTEQLEQAQSSYARLKQAYTHALEQLQLLRRRLFVAKAERRDARAEQLAFDSMLAKVETLAQQLDTAEAQRSAGDPPESERDPKDKKRPARRDLAEHELPVERVELLDPLNEGAVERIGFEESSKLAWQRGGFRRVVIARAVYKTSEARSAPDVPAEFFTVPMPREIVKRGLLAPSMIAHVLASKYVLGVPFYRQEQQYALQGFGLDRGTMSRYAEEVGATLGCIVEAMRAEAMATAFCLSTDATGVSIQLGELKERERGPCRKGHFFVVLADKDHVFFEYQAKHTSAVACEMFRGYSGYLQADAHAIYDALFEGRAPRGQPDAVASGPPPTEVACWSHARRKFWEAAVCKHPLGVEGLRRIDALFAADRALAELSPAQRKVAREQRLRPVLEGIFAWVHAQTPQERGLVAQALGYVRNQEQALARFLEDGRLKLDNNGAERALRSVTTGRKAWLFCGSDDHASAAANLLSLVASCRLHGIEPEGYLSELIRVMPYWPRVRYLELSPRYWLGTRARLDPSELAREYGPLTVPPPAEEQEPSR